MSATQDFSTSSTLVNSDGQHSALPSMSSSPYSSSSAVFEQISTTCVCDSEAKSATSFVSGNGSRSSSASASRTFGSSPESGRAGRFYVDANGSPHRIGQRDDSRSPSNTTAPPAYLQGRVVPVLPLSPPRLRPFTGAEPEFTPERPRRPEISTEAIQAIADRLTAKYEAINKADVPLTGNGPLPVVDLEDSFFQYEGPPREDIFPVCPRAAKKLRIRRVACKVMGLVLPEDRPPRESLEDDELKQQLRRGDAAINRKLLKIASEAHGHRLISQLETIIASRPASAILPFLERSLHSYSHLTVEYTRPSSFDPSQPVVYNPLMQKMEGFNSFVRNSLRSVMYSKIPFEVLCYGVRLYGLDVCPFDKFRDPVEFSRDPARFWPANRRKGGFNSIW